MVHDLEGVGVAYF